MLQTCCVKTGDSKGHAIFATVHPGADRPCRQDRSFLRCLALAQPKALDLAGGGLRQICQELDRPRIFIGGQAALHECLELGVARIRTGLQHNESLGLGKPLLVEHTDDRGFQDRRMLDQRRLDLER